MEDLVVVGFISGAEIKCVIPVLVVNGMAYAKGCQRDADGEQVLDLLSLGSSAATGMLGMAIRRPAMFIGNTAVREGWDWLQDQKNECRGDPGKGGAGPGATDEPHTMVEPAAPLPSLPGGPIQGGH